MAAAGRSEISSRSTEQLNTIDLSDSTHSKCTPRESFSLSPAEQPGYGTSSSLNLLELSSLVQVDTNVKRSEAGTICLGNPDHGLYQLQLKDDESDASSLCSAKSEESCGSQGPTSASQVFDITHESSGNVMSPTQSPPLQTMDREGGNESYDQFRISSSVFQRSRSISPLEWSIASNDSLFSINVGNNSFSRDHLLMLSDLPNYGELTKSDELFVYDPPPAVITSRETEMTSVEFEVEPRMADTTEYNIKDKECLVAENLSERSEPPPAVSWNSSKKSCHSDRSQSSSNSFAFPIRAFCYCLRPCCHLTWSSCCCWNCSRTFWYCWNCSRKGFCCHTSNILADEEAPGGSVPADAKKKHQNIRGTAVSLKSTAKSWLPCCSCPCCKWSCCSYSSSCKWSCCSISSCCKWSCCSCSSCCKWDFCSYSSCCKWNCCSRSCFSCSCFSCHFCHCCYFSQSSHFRRCCHYYPSCHIFRC